ncbi:MAG: SPOR domain-containing protein [Gammaproteobacteria bacterium]|nr:SPOR domain-containing protein [Gammaproteobacteria bacterium]
MIFLLVALNGALWFGPQLAEMPGAPAWVKAAVETELPDHNPAALRLRGDAGAGVRLLGEAEVRRLGARPACLRIGPFTGDGALQAAAATLGKLGIAFEAVTAPARRVESWRVFLGPFTDEAEVQRNRQWLSQSGEDGHFVVREDGRMLVSLGLFTQRRTAAAEQRRVMEILALAPQIRREMRGLPGSGWLETAQPLKPEVLRSGEWGDPGASARALRCRG